MNNKVEASSGAPAKAVMVFEQQPKESNKAFAAFKSYLEHGPERSLALVVDKIGKRKTMRDLDPAPFTLLCRV